MKIRALCLLVLFALAPIFAHAATATINWTAPTVAIDGSALTGAQAITNYQVWVSTSTIPSTTTSPPTATVTGVTTTSQPITASAGAKVFTRVKACNAGGCSDFSTESSATVPVSVPGIPTSVTVTIQMGP